MAKKSMVEREKKRIKLNTVLCCVTFLTMDITLENISVVFTALCALNLGKKLLSHLFKTFLRPGKNLKKLGKWAVITGATDGIGKAYAMSLAKKGMSIVLISRTESKLQDVKKEIEAKGYDGVEVTYVVCDYSKFNEKAVQEKVAKEIKDLEVGVLINNVGVSYRYARYWHELSEEEIQGLITMNIDSTLWMTKMVLPGMLERKSGAIVNLSSGSALYTMPGLAQYAGAKGFVEKFSRGINAEYSSKGVTCQCQVPFYVATKLAKLRKSLITPTPTEWVNLAVRWIGYSGDSVAQPFIMHALQGYIMEVLPESIVTKMTMDQHMSIRKRGMKKDARLAEEAAAKKK